MHPAHTQSSYGVRCETGPTGAAAVVDGVEVAVVVDVLSFTTTTGVAVARGVRVHPFSWRDERAADHAARLGAVLAVGRLEARDRLRDRHGDEPAVSLSPAAMTRVSGVDRVVLPSPNGSTITTLLAGRAPVVVAASLRDRAAVGAWVARRAAGRPVAVVASGERWPDGSLRPAVEDTWGAGAVVAALREAGHPGPWSPEALAAEAAFTAVSGPGVDPGLLRARLLACAGGRELVDAGFADDVEVAAALDADDVVPVLDDDGAFAPAPPD